VLYASATGASDVNNLAYAVRLGLWGPGTAFAGREQFISEIRDGGIAAMELVARDLKASGLYLSRALSFAGASNTTSCATTSRLEQIAIYDTYCEAWTIIHQQPRGRARTDRRGRPAREPHAQQRRQGGGAQPVRGHQAALLCQVLLSLKLPSIYPAVDEHLAAGESVVVQLVSTAESILNRRLDELDPEEREALDLDLSPREAIVDYLTRAFPTRQMEEYVDELGDVRSRPMWDEAGNPVHNPQAEGRTRATDRAYLRHAADPDRARCPARTLRRECGGRSHRAQSNAWSAMARASSASKAARRGPTLPRPPRS
jgi:hypothetical protein